MRCRTGFAVLAIAIVAIIASADESNTAIRPLLQESEGNLATLALRQDNTTENATDVDATEVANATDVNDEDNTTENATDVNATDVDDEDDEDEDEDKEEEEDEDEDKEEEEDEVATPVAEADLGSSARCKAVVGGATPGSNPCHIGCGGSNPVQDNPNWYAWAAAKGLNTDPSTPIENTAALCPDGAITSKGLYISQSLPGYDDLKWCGFCYPWGGTSDLALAKVSGAATCQQLGDADNKDHFVCSTAVVGHVMWAPSSMGILVGKRVLCKKGHCTTSKVGLCIDVRQPVFVPGSCDDANAPNYDPNATICTSSESVNSFLIKDDKEKNLKFANLAVQVLEHYNNNITGTPYACAGQGSGSTFSYPDLAQKTIALK